MASKTVRNEDDVKETKTIMTKSMELVKKVCEKMEIKLEVHIFEKMENVLLETKFGMKKMMVLVVI